MMDAGFLGPGWPVVDNEYRFTQPYSTWDGEQSKSVADQRRMMMS
eukprot:COSAG01_NODE_57479_length_312_cov_0.633803_1_plen_44_part_10